MISAINNKVHGIKEILKKTEILKKANIISGEEKDLSIVLNDVINDSPFYKEKSLKINNSMLLLQKRIIEIKEQILIDKEMDESKKKTTIKLLDRMIDFILTNFYNDLKNKNLNKIIEYRGKKDILLNIISIVSLNPNIKYNELLNYLEENDKEYQIKYKKILSNNMIKTMLDHAKNLHNTVSDIKDKSYTWNDFYEQDINNILKLSGYSDDALKIMDLEIKANEFMKEIKNILPDLYETTSKIFNEAFEQNGLTFISDYERDRKMLTEQYIKPLEERINTLLEAVKGINKVIEEIKETSELFKETLIETKKHKDLDKFHDLIRKINKNIDFINKNISAKNNKKIEKGIMNIKENVKFFINDICLIGVKIPGYYFNTDIFIENLSNQISNKIKDETIKEKIIKEIKYTFDSLISSSDINIELSSSKDGNIITTKKSSSSTSPIPSPDIINDTIGENGANKIINKQTKK